MVGFLMLVLVIAVTGTAAEAKTGATTRNSTIWTILSKRHSSSIDIFSTK
jgi:hypothetical protein